VALLALPLVILLAGRVSVAQATFPGVNGQIAFPTGRGGEDVDLFAINSDGTFARPLAVQPGRDFQPAWSPDGRQFAWVNNATGKRQIRIADADGRNVRRFVQSDAVDFGPAWSPDGRKLVFTSERTGATELYVANADSSDVRQLTFQRLLADGRPNWSPDGSQIAWHLLERDPLKFQIYVMNADGSNQRRLFPNRTTRGDFFPNWSPDGRKILWLSYGNGGDGGELWVANADGSNPQVIVELKSPLEVRSAVWSPDGKLIAYTAPFASGKIPEVWVVRADGTGPSSIIGIAKTQFAPTIDWQPVADRGAQPSSLLRNGGAEDGFGGNFVGVDYPVPSWETNGGLTNLRYGLPGFPTPPALPVVMRAAHKAQKVLPLRGGAGKRFFFGGNQAVSRAVQVVTLPAPGAEIDTGRAKVTLSGLLGGRGAEADEGTVVATFLNAQNNPIGVVQIGPVTPTERSNRTSFVRRLQTATLPAGTRRIRVTVTAIRFAGQTNDAYFENLALGYSKPEAQPPTAPPTPVQPPAATPPGATGNGPTGTGRVSKLKISPTPFAASGKNTAAVAQRGRTPSGAKISYRLDRATVVTLKFDRRSSGRRNSSGQCVKTTSANRNRKRCTRNIPAGSILRFGRAGSNTVKFTGRVKRKALKSGSYRVTASARNRASARFRIVRR